MLGNLAQQWSKEKLTCPASPWCRPTEIGVLIIAAQAFYRVEIGSGQWRPRRSLIMMSLSPKKPTFTVNCRGSP
jgi:hypothetical protein